MSTLDSHPLTPFNSPSEEGVVVKHTLFSTLWRAPSFNPLSFESTLFQPPLKRGAGG